MLLHHLQLNLKLLLQMDQPQLLLKLMELFSNCTNSEFLIQVYVELILTMLSLLQVMDIVISGIQIIILLETHGDQAGEKVDISILLLLMEVKESVESNKHLFGQQLIEILYQYRLYLIIFKNIYLLQKNNYN